MELSQANAGGAIPSWRQICLASLRRLWRSPKMCSLRVRETAALGERRFVAVIECERQRFLIGASSGSITLLARLADKNPAEQERG